MVASAPGPVGVVAKIASMALKAGQGIAESGGDPVVEIERILRSEKGVQAVDEKWQDWILKNFRQSEPAPPPSSRPETLSYEGDKDTQPSMPRFTKEDLLDDADDTDAPIDIYDQEIDDEKT